MKFVNKKYQIFYLLTQLLLFATEQIVVADSPLYINSRPVTLDVAYTNVQDNAGGSGFSQIKLFVRKDTGAWVDSGVVSSVATGNLAYLLNGSDGTYYFSAQAKDLAGNASTVGDVATRKIVVLDTVSPIPGYVSAPSASSKKNITVTYYGAQDSNSGIATVELWEKIEGGAWGKTGTTSTNASGSFTYTVPSDGTYYFSTRIIDKAGNQSPIPTGNNGAKVVVTGTLSNDECPSDPAKTTPGLCGCGVAEDTADVDRDGIINCLDTDNDNDGVSDDQERIDGTNPLDKGSMLEVPGTTFCSEWNGFLGGLWNILELVNRSSSTRKVTTVLYDISGQEVSSQSCNISSGGQCDVLIHDMSGRKANSFGKVCTSHDGVAGDLDGRMVYYKQSTGIRSQGSNFEFAFAMPVTNGKLGDQFLSFNTYQPSLRAQDAANMVANWIQITNISSKSTGGRLTFYAQDGQVLGSQDVSLAGGQRADISGHQFGTSLVGMVAWVPNNKNIRFSVRNVRYLYDNATGENSFTTAFQLEGLYGSKMLQSAPLDTRESSAVVEVLNTSSVSTTAELKVYSELGELKGTVNLTIPANGSYHLITDPILGSNQRGMVTAKSTGSGKLAVIVMQYKRSLDGGIDYLYGLAAKPPVGTVLSGSYNTFLNQQSELVLVNSGSVAQVVSVTVRSPSVGVQEGIPVTVPAKGSTVLNVNDYASVNEYGILEIQPDTNNTISAWVLRRNGTSYVMPTPVR